MEQVQNGLIPQLAFSPVDFSQFPQQVMSELQSSNSRVVLTFDTEKTMVPIRHIPEPLTFDGNNSYLLIGCLGGLGRSLTYVFPHQISLTHFHSRFFSLLK